MKQTPTPKERGGTTTNWGSFNSSPKTAELRAVFRDDPNVTTPEGHLGRKLFDGVAQHPEGG